MHTVGENDLGSVRYLVTPYLFTRNEYLLLRMGIGGRNVCYFFGLLMFVRSKALRETAMLSIHEL